jgi:hypothetical protein
MYTREEVLEYRCPRWNDWPNIGLYMDQVTSLLAEYVSGFYPVDQKKPVTSMMINNYVKQKIIMPSKNKRYNREHLAYLYILFLLKPVLSLTEICDGIAYMTKEHTIMESYDSFCEATEAALATAFGSSSESVDICPENDDIIRIIALAFAYTMRAKFCLGTVQIPKTRKTKSKTKKG